MNKDDEVNWSYQYDNKNEIVIINVESNKCKGIGYCERYQCKQIDNISEKEIKDIKKITKKLIQKVYNEHKNKISDAEFNLYTFLIKNNFPDCGKLIIKNKKELISLMNKL